MAAASSCPARCWKAGMRRTCATSRPAWPAGVKVRSSTSCAPAAPIARRPSAAWPTWSNTARSTCPTQTCWRWRAI
ncbi:hypothetical protein G6F61_015244 [Rhizopus arrhizus]|nr:hypothetical protein G6F40_017514 [Rhizopus arrhizus]KAG1319094.1 hypothetical protein G6F61_015244 [Rhizopus arrhizus]